MQTPHHYRNILFSHFRELISYRGKYMLSKLIFKHCARKMRIRKSKKPADCRARSENVVEWACLGEVVERYKSFCGGKVLTHYDATSVNWIFHDTFGYFRHVVLDRASKYPNYTRASPINQSRKFFKKASPFSPLVEFMRVYLTFCLNTNDIFNEWKHLLIEPSDFLSSFKW